MRNQVSTIIRNVTRQKDEPLNILCTPTHESSQTEQAKTNHNFYLFQSKTLKTWDTNYRPVPKNFTLLEPETIPSDIEFDLILSQNNADQYPILKQLSDRYNVPLVNYYHTTPHTSLTARQIQSIKVKADANIFISAFNRKSWGFDENEGVVVHHGIDTRLFQPRESGERDNILLSVVNKWQERDEWCGYKLWEKITIAQLHKKTLPVRVLGDNPGLSVTAKSTEDLSLAYASSLIYLNTSLISPVPTSLMEGAASGCCIISTDNCAIPEVFTNGKDALLSNSPTQLRYHCENMLRNPEVAAEYGRKARDTIVNNFSLDTYVQNLNKVFYGVLRY